MAAIAAGSREALAVAYERYVQDAYGAAYRILGSEEEARDVVQEVFVGLPRAAESYQERGRLGGWIRSVVVRTALMTLRSGRRRKQREFEYVQAVWADTPGSMVDQLELLRVRAAVAALPERLRLVFMLKEIEGYGHDAIARSLGITSGASRVRLHRAWTQLRKGLGLS